MKIRTRFAPSPTGFLHIGGLRTALYSYAFAKAQKGDFILRIEDTDQRRLVPGATEKIYQMLKKFDLKWDEGPLVGGPHKPYVQSERAKMGIYQKYAKQLVKNGSAYYCFCPPESKEEIEERHERGELRLKDKCRDLSIKKAEERIGTGQKAAIRLRVSDKGKISYFDFVLKKEISWEAKNVDEVMLLKSDGFPSYHLAVVVDDALMEVSHIIRGRDWLPSTPVHLLLFNYLGFLLPKIGHLTDILDPGGGKLSKRKGSVSCEDFLAQGYLPEAILNFIMLVGWAPKDDREIFSLSEFVKMFFNGELQTANPVFNRKKMDWLNGIYIRKKPDKELVQMLKPFAPKGMDSGLIGKTVPLVKERMVKLSEYPDLVNFLIKEPTIDKKLLVQKGGGNKQLIEHQLSATCLAVRRVSYQLPASPSGGSALKFWQAGVVEKLFRDLAAKNSWHVGKFFMAVRIAVTGKTITPPLFESLALLGKEKTIRRLEAAIKAFS